MAKLEEDIRQLWIPELWIRKNDCFILIQLPIDSFIDPKMPIALNAEFWGYILHICMDADLAGTRYTVNKYDMCNIE